jgi:hypothetical protein
MPFEGMGIWWVKVKVSDCKKALKKPCFLGAQLEVISAGVWCSTVMERR